MEKVKFFSEPSRFFERILPVYAAEETRHSLILGVARRLKDNEEPYGKAKPLLAVLSAENGRVRASAVMTPPHPLLIQSDPLDEEALERMAEAVLSNGWELNGVNGVAEASDLFTEIWSQKTGKASKLERHLRAYELHEVTMLPSPGGAMRIAKFSDMEVALEMTRAMQTELNLDPFVRWDEKKMQPLISSGKVFMWEDEGQVVSMAMLNRPQLTGIAISGVYTPPQYRGRGYAGANVAALSQWALAHGYKMTNLFTDQANPISNKIYQEIGYRPVCDYHEYAILKETDRPRL